MIVNLAKFRRNLLFKPRNSELSSYCSAATHSTNSPLSTQELIQLWYSDSSRVCITLTAARFNFNVPYVSSAILLQYQHTYSFTNSSYITSQFTRHSVTPSLLLSSHSSNPSSNHSSTSKPCAEHQQARQPIIICSMLTTQLNSLSCKYFGFCVRCIVLYSLTAILAYDSDVLIVQTF